MMKRFSLTISIFFVFSLYILAQIADIPLNAQEDNIFYHTVEPGQTVYGISIMYQVDEEDIYSLNPSSRELIKVGEVLKIPQKKSFNPSVEDDIYVFHTIRPGETLYGVSKTYKITPEQLSKANLGLTPQTFAAGKTIRVPAIQSPAVPVIEKKMMTKEIEYVVKRGDSMFSLTRNFNVTGEKLIELNPALKNGLKTRMVLKIPVQTEETIVVNPEHNEFDFNTFMAYRNRTVKVDVIRIAVLLPFSVSRLSPSRTEFYEGLLMAVENMQHYGATIELITFDIGEGIQKTRDILQSDQIHNCQLIIGGETNEQIELIAYYAMRNEVNYVTPFSSTCDQLTSRNARMFQMNISAQYLYNYVSAWSCSLFSQYKIIFVNTNDSKEDKMQFVKAFKADLSLRLIPFKEINYNAGTFSNDVSGLLSSTQPNLIVPLSSSLETLNKIRGPLRALAESKPSAKITLFGYPEWQKYSSDCLGDFYALDTHIYASFFANNLSPEVRQFYANYKFWFNKTMIPAAYPKYAMLGYDTGMFFITAIQTFGANFENNIHQVNYKSLEYGFRFERVNNWGGFINTNLYMVNYKKDFTITRIER
ncbi:MAG: LysM peptidoglycan-binding domain-containing protein [Tannerella sp.]|jgi:LysM repeat protein|nr:LysM peptidoglycan-binding domain-containing protein [Tannerella sp.]